MPKHYLKTKILKIFKSYYEKNSINWNLASNVTGSNFAIKKYRNIEIHEKVVQWAVHGKLGIFLKLKTLKLEAIFLLLGETDLYIISAKIF